ncbi:MAG: PorT family protein [Muribaculaceae bacterium]|nr:PorT family protein [Muribaculaceae bacterium]
MKFLRYIILTLFSVLAVAGAGNAEARNLNDKLLNRPYADLRKWHLGFSVGTHTQDLSFSHNGYITDNGETWFMEQPSFSPGFNVTGLLDLRLNDYFSVRFTPGMYFGNKIVKMLDTTNGTEEKQNIKTSYVVMPLDVKFAGLRYRNARPYVTGGAMAVFDVAKKRSDYLKMKATDFYLTVGFGCDFYLPFFKFIPEIKFCFGLADILEHDRPDLVDDPGKLKFTQSLKKVTSQMVVVSFYFE